MRVSGACPSCQQPIRVEILSAGDQLKCESCQWSRPVLAEDIADNSPKRCLMCGCDDLWRQKDFSPKLGVAIVGLGIGLSTIAYYNYWYQASLAILVVFALFDMLLYAVMSDVLVCYRCGASHRRTNLEKAEHPAFDLEVNERYRQEAIRLKETRDAGQEESGV